MSLNYTWLPASAPDVTDALKIVKAEGSHLITDNGLRIYDAISSWWCKPLGHGHFIVKNSIYEQLGFFEHHIAANAYNDVIEDLSKQLVGIFSGMSKVMYASDGSSAIEIAMKLSYETRVITGQKHRSKFAALCGAYHGETVFTLSVCGIDSYRNRYADLLQKNYFVDNICYVASRFDPLWSKCDFDEEKYNNFFAKIAADTSALIIEPIVQGAAGLKIISRDFLVQLVLTARKYDIHIISDEIMVGLGRLGCLSVSAEILDFEPDIVCFAKNLTAGSVPMSAAIINAKITDVFKDKVFAHSHTHSCNAIGARVALNYLKYLDNSSLIQNVQIAEIKLLELMQSLAAEFAFIRNPRAIGAIAACDLKLNKSLLEQIFYLGVRHGIYLRPIGNMLYIMPPLYNINTDLHEIKHKLLSMFKTIIKLLDA